MSSRGKKTTMAKLARESRLRERRLDKAARKDARKRAAELGLAYPADTPGDEGFPGPEGQEALDGGEGQPADEPRTELEASPRTRD